jgi:proteasome lid subunit RPN8/RPN11
MDADITFGDVEEERPRVMRRPDEDRHLAVVACGQPRDTDLPIFVDLDTMVDMENHAQTNTSVELGGVLLGGQYIDGEGNPFVIVTDCLRADHFEATKGSFKFTHETWSDIQRRLSEYPDDLRMVGWYHTHPDWGVFLSGMDMFICDNFFNKPLDLALVIDPCRDDRGWFQWTTQGRRGTFRTGGFYLTSSRFREEELQFVAHALEGGSEMPLATRSGSQTSGGFGAPVVNVVSDRSSSHWIQIAVLGSLTLQTVLVALLALSLMGRGASVDEAKLKEEEARLQAKNDTLGGGLRQKVNRHRDGARRAQDRPGHGQPRTEGARRRSEISRGQAGRMGEIQEKKREGI